MNLVKCYRNEQRKIVQNSAENNYQKSRSFDLFVINTQECLRSIGASFFNSSKEDWENALKIHFGDEYINLVNSNLNSIHIGVFVKKEKINFFTELKTGFIKTGFMNVLGNKGAIGVSMKYQDKKMLFICCHLSSGQTKSYARNNDFKKINNLNDIKLGLKQGKNSVYQSYLQDEEGEKNNFRSKYFQDLTEIKSSPQKLLMLKKGKIQLSRTKLSTHNDNNFNINDNIDSILNSKNHKFNKNKEESYISQIHKKNTNNYLSKISNDNTYSNIKNMVSPKVDYLLIRGETNNNTGTKIISSNIDEQLNKIKTDNCEELEDTIGVNQYDLVIFSGDLNYRINMEIEDCKKIIEAKDYESLLVKDQLYTSIRSKEIEMDDFFEGNIHFPPTYKFQDGTDNYDYNERVPGWTDRILYRANNLSDVILCKYSSIFEAKTSDHKPVYAIFKINFNSHEKNKEKYKKIEEGCYII